MTDTLSQVYQHPVIICIKKGEHREEDFVGFLDGTFPFLSKLLQSLYSLEAERKKGMKKKQNKIAEPELNFSSMYMTDLSSQNP